MVATPMPGSTDSSALDLLDEASSPSAHDQLEDIKETLDKQKSSSEEREKLLLESLDRVFNKKEIDILNKIDKPEAFNDDMRGTLSSATEIYLAILKVKGKKADSIPDITNEFTFDDSDITRAFIKALVFIQNNQNADVSKWYMNEAWSNAQTEATQIATAGVVVSQIITGTTDVPGNAGDTKTEDKETKGVVDKVKDFASKNSTAVKLFAFAGAAVGGWWLYKKYFKKKDVAEASKDSTTGSTAMTAAKVALVTAGGAFVAGQVLGMEKVRQFISKDKDSWVNSRYVDALISAADGEFSNAFNYLIYGPITPEDQTKYERLSNVFDVDKERVTGIARMNFDEFMGGKASSMFQLSGTKEAEEKIRTSIKDNYLDNIKAQIPDLSKLTVGQVLISAFERGLIKDVEKSGISAGQKQDLGELEKKNDEEVGKFKTVLENPKENIAEIQEMNEDLKNDLDLLDKNVDSFWGDLGLQMEAAIGWPPDAADNQEYGDLKKAREYLLANVTDGMAKDHEAFVDMNEQVDEFTGFLNEHKNEENWSEETMKEYEAYKTKILELKSKVNAAIIMANEDRTKTANEDIADLNMEDLKEGGEFVLIGLCGNVLKVIGWEMQEIVDEDTNVVAYALLFTQVTGALTEYAAATDGGGMNALKIIGKNVVTGPGKAIVETIKLPVSVYHFKMAFEYSPSELAKLYSKGEMSIVQLRARLEWALKFERMFDSIPNTYLKEYVKTKLNFKDLVIGDEAFAKLFENHHLEWERILNGEPVTDTTAYGNLQKYLGENGIRTEKNRRALAKLVDEASPMAKDWSRYLLTLEDVSDDTVDALKKIKNDPATAPFFDEILKSHIDKSVPISPQAQTALDGLGLSTAQKDGLKKIKDNTAKIEEKLIVEGTKQFKVSEVRVVEVTDPATGIKSKIYEYKMGGKWIRTANPESMASLTDVQAAFAEKMKSDPSFDYKKFAAEAKSLKYFSIFEKIMGTAGAVFTIYYLETATDKRKAICELAAGMGSFMAGMKVTDLALGSKFPGSPIARLIVDLLGGVAAAFGLTEPISSILEHYFEKVPASYAVSKEVSSIMEKGAVMSMVHITAGSLEKGILRSGLKGIGMKGLTEVMSKKIGSSLLKNVAKIIGEDAFKMIVTRLGTKGVASLVPLFDDATVIGVADDVITLGMWAWMAYDVYEIVMLIANGMKIESEMEERQKHDIESFEIQGTKTRAAFQEKLLPLGLTNDRISELTEDQLFDILRTMKEDIVVDIKREGMPGKERWQLHNAEAVGISIFNEKNEAIAEIKDEDAVKLEEVLASAPTEDPSQDSTQELPKAA